MGKNKIKLGIDNPKPMWLCNQNINKENSNLIQILAQLKDMLDF